MPDHRHLIAWSQARQLVLRVTTLAKERWKPWAGPMLWQLSRAALSSQLNIAEGWALGKPRQRIRHWRIAYGSAQEAVDLLELLRDSDFLAGDEAEELLKNGRDVCRILRHWLISWDAKRPRGDQETGRKGD